MASCALIWIVELLMCMGVRCGFSIPAVLSVRSWEDVLFVLGSDFFNCDADCTGKGTAMNGTRCLAVHSEWLEFARRSQYSGETHRYMWVLGLSTDTEKLLWNSEKICREIVCG